MKITLVTKGAAKKPFTGRTAPDGIEQYFSPLGEVEIHCTAEEREEIEHGSKESFDSDVLTAGQFTMLAGLLSIHAGRLGLLIS